jgi:anti-anti-sigma regulatory factor
VTQTPSPDHSDGAAVLTFAGSLSVATAERVRASLLAALQAQQDILVDCTQADDVDVSFIQSLLAARLTAQGLGLSIALAAPASGALHEALSRGGFLGRPGAEAQPDDIFWTQTTDVP